MNNLLKGSLLAVLLIVITNCSTDKKEPITSKSGSLRYGNVDLKYNICGSADNTVLFLHGWAINKSFWQHQVDQFCNDYNVITVDLPGFGESTSKREEFTLEAYGLDIVKLIDHLELRNLLIVGHSMSGSVMLEVAYKRPNAIKALVGIDNFKDLSLNKPDSATIAQQLQVVEVIGSDFSNIISDYASSTYVHTATGDSLRQLIVSTIASSNETIALNSLGHVLQYFKDAKLLMESGKKLYLINSLEPPTNTLILDSLNIDYSIHYIDSTMHYPMVERPLEFNKKLKLVLEDVFN